MSEHNTDHATISELTQWIDAFLVDRKAGNLSANTIRFYRQCLKNFVTYCHKQGYFTPESITADQFRRFLLWLETRGHNPGGVHCHYRICKTFFRWWVVETEPSDYYKIFQKVKAPKIDTTPLPPVPLEDVNALVETCGKDWYGLRDKALILALLDTGARAREFLALNVEDVNLETGAVHIDKGKGNKSRTVFLGKTARRAVRCYLQARNGGPLWIADSGERLSYSGLRGLLSRRANTASIDFPTPHAFRRAFCVNMLRAGVDLETLRRLMGHADLSVLYRYLALVDEDLQRAHAHASPADRLSRHLNETMNERRIHDQT